MTLTDEEIRVKVAELDGWEDIRGRALKAKGWHEQGITNGALDYCGVPDYLNDERAALQLCDRMHSEGYFESHEREPEGPWRVMFWMGGRSIRYSASDPSLARAVTLAFLKAHTPPIRPETKPRP